MALNEKSELDDEGNCERKNAESCVVLQATPFNFCSQGENSMPYDDNSEAPSLSLGTEEKGVAAVPPPPPPPPMPTINGPSCLAQTISLLKKRREADKGDHASNSGNGTW